MPDSSLIEAADVGRRTPDGALRRAAGQFRAIGEVGRLRVLLRLSAGEACVTDLAADLGENMSTISQRLRLLRRHGLVRRRRDGKHVYYMLADQHVVELVANGIAHASEPVGETYSAGAREGEAR